MIRRLALILVVFMIAFLALALLAAGNIVSISIDGKEITSPFGSLISTWGFILTLVILFCVAILLAFVLAGVGLIVLGCLALVGLIVVAIALPILLPLLIPLFIVWVFCSLTCRLFFK